MDDKVRVDLHCHTTTSYDGKVDPVRLVELARERGLTHIAITDHEAIDGAVVAQAAAIEGITVIVGEEVRTTEGDLILLFVKEPIPGALSPEVTVKLARDQGCVVGLAHPFDFYRPSIGRGAASPAQRQRLARLVDYVEVHNGRVRHDTAGVRAADFAREHGLSQVAVSDAHTERDLGRAYTELNGAVATAEQLRLATHGNSVLHVSEAGRRWYGVGRLLGRDR